MEVAVCGITRACEIWGVDKESVNAIAISMAKARTQCKPTLFGNAAVYDEECPEGFELETAGEVYADVIMTADQGTSDAIAAAIAASKKVCKPTIECNTTVDMSKKCEPDGDGTTVDAICTLCDNGETWVHGGEFCLPGLSEEEIDNILGSLIDATAVCPPPQYKNDEATGYKNCPDGKSPCVTHTVLAGEIISIRDKYNANDIAQGLASAGTFCCPPDPLTSLVCPEGQMIISQGSGSWACIDTTACDDSSSGTP
jgi:hypothetical protein